MRRFAVRWTWRLTSPLHCGSGISRPGVADRLIYRDHERKAVIPGEAVKGALRMSAEVIATWLVREAEIYEQRQPLEPRRVPVARIFGGDAHAHFTAARPMPDDARSAKHPVVASTSIDPGTGTAKDETLRKSEVLSPGPRFESSYWADVPSEDVDAVATLFLAALAATESIGGKAGIGWGRVSLDQVQASIDGHNIDRKAVLSVERLEDLQRALRMKVQPAEDDSAVDESPQPAPGVWHVLRLELTEPACFPATPEVSNKVESEPFIAATTLRGALRSMWRRQGTTELEVRRRLSSATRWSHAFPEHEGRLCLPAPRSMLVRKRASSQGDRGPIYDSVSAQRRPADEGGKIALKPHHGEWIYTAAEGPCFMLQDGLKTLRMQVARDYLTGSKSEGALYAKESLNPCGIRYVARAYVPDDVWSEGDRFELLIGKRKSAGNGRAVVTVQKGVGPSFPSGRPDEASSPDVYVQLVTPAIVRDEHGQPRRGLPLSYWQSLARDAGLLVELRPESRQKGKRAGSERATVAGRRGGWMAPWRHPRAAAVTIDSGSTWRLRCADATQAATLRKHLREQVWQIGERRHEGFGWIAVDPPWAGYVRTPRQRPTAPGRTAPGPEPWPDCETEDRAELRQIVQQLPAASGQLSAARAPLQALADRARDAATPEACDRVREFCERMTKDRDRPAWAALYRDAPARMLLDRYWTPGIGEERGSRDPRRAALLRFALEALIVRATTAVGSDV